MMDSMDAELAFLATATPVEHKTDNHLLHHQLVTSPLVTYSALKHHAMEFPSRGLLGTSAGDRIYVNTNAPSSAVICGIQGSGKSHTVSCLLECALISDTRIGSLPEPLSALVFHFDTQDTGRPCEAAFLSLANRSSDAAVAHVTILCSPSNLNRRRAAYASLPQVRIAPLFLSEGDLTADRMLALMGCDNMETMPLYMHTALLLIRTMGVDAFRYSEFKHQISREHLNPTQKAMIKLRLDLLDSFIRPTAPNIQSYFTPGGLVLVDLTDPFLDGLTATVLFDIVLGSFTQWQSVCGKLVVLDEAHKYLTNNDSARLTQSISNIIRLQRHLATRVIIATQEPTVVPATILDLASIIICHRFSSPAWCAHLARHVSTGGDSVSWYNEVMLLDTGDALVFSPAAAVAGDIHGGVALLGRDYFKLRVRPRLTLDGGASLLAVGRSLPPLVMSSDAQMSLPPPIRAQESGAAPSQRIHFIPTPEAILPEDQSTRLHQQKSVPGPRLILSVASAISPDSLQPLGSPATDNPVTPAAAAPITDSDSSRRVPAHLKHLVGWLTRNGAADTPVSLGDTHSALFWIGKKHYVGMPNKQWWSLMMQEAVDAGLIELINTDVKKKELKARGEEKMIRLLERGPFLYV
ncbi:hypothetical protein B0H15DRAFT_862818 [Mycena belliarum]|uniref:P-loop containing nucleoside triphosphate hydrolase protein n=1 Tax=Mycena belliarum TaxID=1033014 RepID=A0AAD6XGC2_9AGAR|nr:hypothetical protein B0H15DRAFT_862818 [Mycena belliae]